MTSEARPPRIAAALLRAATPGEERDALLGDLEEEYRERSVRFGARAARAWYRKQAVTSLGPLLWFRVERSLAVNRGNRLGKAFPGDGLLFDVRTHLRSLLREPAFSLLYVLTVGAGIGLATAVFSVVDSVLMKPLPYGHPERLVVLWEKNQASGRETEPASPPNFVDWRGENRTFEALAAWSAQSVTVHEEGEEPMQLTAAEVSSDFFRVMDVPPLLGRGFRPGEDAPDAGRLAVLSESFWERHFSRDPDVLGRVLLLDREPYEVVGVMPRDFRAPTPDSELWVNLRLDPSRDPRKHRYLRVLGRLRAGVALDEAQADLDLVAAGLEADHPDSNRGYRIAVVPALEQVTGNARPPLLALFSAVVVFLLVAGANAASLAMARAAERRDEWRLRAALGAPPGRIRRQAAIESLALSLVSLIVGYLIASRAVPIVLNLEPGLVPRAEEVTLSAGAIGFGAAAAAAVALLGSLFHAAPVKPLRSRRESDGPARTRARRFLMVGEIALSLVLVLAAGLLLRSYVALRSVDPGFRYRSVLAARVNLDSLRYPDKASVILYFERLRDRLASLPGVAAVGFTTTLPMTRFGIDFDLPFRVPGRESPPPGLEPRADYRVITPGLLEALEIPLVEGRYFEERDRADAKKVAVVSRTMARSLWKGESAVGKHITLLYGEPPIDYEVVGVAGDIRHHGLGADNRPELYVPLSQVRFAFPYMSLTLRSENGAPLDLASRVRAEALAVDGEEPLYGLTDMASLVDGSLAQDRFLVTLITVLSSAALFLAAIGLYALVSYQAARRHREIGIRLAIGASRPQVLGAVLGESLLLAGWGAAAGLTAGWFVTHLLGGMLHGVRPHDPLTWVAAIVLLALVAVAASYGPARRAASVDPAVTLRQE